MELQAKGDRDLVEKLLTEREVKKAVEHFEKEAKDLGARRQLLATAIRLTKEMAPDVHRVVCECQDALDFQHELEVYVYPSPQYNAGAVRPERGRLFIMIASSLLEAFEEAELKFVVGHEFGHHMFDHHQIPVGPLLNGETRIRPGLALQLFAWQRYAEISADRTGMACAGGLEPAAAGLFKLASGIRGDRIQIRIDQFMSQVRDLRKEADLMAKADERPRADWFSTHPFSPLRLQACDLFADSELMVDGGTAMPAIETQVEDLMSLMNPNYLQEKSDTAEAMRRLLFAGGVLIAAAAGEIQKEALSALEELLGPGSVPSEVNVDAVRDDLQRRVDSVKDKVPQLRRSQVIRDLVVIARADDHITHEEKRIMYSLAAKVGVDRGLVDSALCTGCELD